MNRYKLIIISALFYLIQGSVPGYSQEDTIFSNCPPIKGEYFSETKPGLVPEVFAPYLLNSKIHHLHSTPVFTPDGKEFFFSVYVNDKDPQKIFHAEKQEETWQKPKLATFSGRYQDGGPVLSADGNTLYFYSKRPDTEGDAQLPKSRIWYVRRNSIFWGEPKVLIFPTELGTSFYPSFQSIEGDFYFFAEVGERDYDIFQCKIGNERATDIRRLNEPISLPGKNESRAIVDPLNKVLIFSTYDRLGDKKGALYCCKKKEDESWGEPKKMEQFNDYPQIRVQGFTPDGKYFFFSSYKEDYEQIFWVSSEVIFDGLDPDETTR